MKYRSVVFAVAAAAIARDAGRCERGRRLRTRGPTTRADLGERCRSSSEVGRAPSRSTSRTSSTDFKKLYPDIDT